MMFSNFFEFRKQVSQNKKLTPETVGSWKYFSAWKQTLDKSKSSLDFGLPWFTFQAISFLDTHLRPGDKIFEFGGGSSTKYFMNKNCEVHTAEHHRGWFENLEKEFAGKGGRGWNGYLLEPEHGSRGTNGEDPLHYHSTDKEYEGFNFHNYASRIDGFHDGYFDVVLVDGRARPSCIYHAVKKIRKGGYLIVDNTERAYYTTYFNTHFADQFTVALDVFGPVPTIRWFHKTTIWQKK